MENSSLGKWQERAAKLFTYIVIILIIWLTLKYFLAVILPFAVALFIAITVNYFASKASLKTGTSKKVFAIIYLIFFLILLFTISIFTVNRLVSEAGELLSRLEESGGDIISSADKILSMWRKLLSRIPFLRNLNGIQGAEEMLSSLLKNTVIKIGDGLTTFLGKILIGTPSALISILIGIIASFYFSIDLDNIKASLKRALPNRITLMTHKAAKSMKRIGKCYLKAYAILFLITFGEVFIGLLILGRDYAFLMALLIALVDILPVLGTGIVLVPWGLFMILTKNYFVGFGLLILYAAVTVVRQIAEPHLIGESLGLHPLLSLFAIFAGWKLLGIMGVFIAPAIAIILKELFSDSERKKLTDS